MQADHYYNSPRQWLMMRTDKAPLNRGSLFSFLDISDGDQLMSRIKCLHVIVDRWACM